MVAGSTLTFAIDAVLRNQSNSSSGSGFVSGGLLSSGTKLPISEKSAKKIATAFQDVQSQYLKKVKEETLVDGAINGLINALNDPYSVYMTAEEAKAFNESVFEAQISGIGCEVSMENGRITVVTPIKGSPAEKAGVRAKDVILSVNGTKLAGMSLNEAVQKIRGKKGTEAKLEISRPGTSDVLKITVVRDQIDIETVYQTYYPDQKIGKLEIRQFSDNTDERFLKDLASLEAKGMKGLIIDVRNNPGGSLDAVSNILDALVPSDKAIFKVEDRNGQIDTRMSAGPGKSYPIVVLTNGGSASASEILAGALHDSVKAELIGEKTFGKGLVQNIFDSGVGDDSTMKLTIAKWLTPNGTYINKKGIAPTVAVKPASYFETVPINKDKVLKYDSLGDDVSNLQQILVGLGFHHGRTDGYFDYATKGAVMAAQRAYGLAATGVVDAKTAIKLEEKLIAKISKPENDNQLAKARAVLAQQLN
jgi:carboxyl-terminal processing protease